MSDKVFTIKEVAAHNKKDSCWVIIHGKVLDVTQFLSEHPGSEKPLLEYAGKDATEAFEKKGHSAKARELLAKYKIGVLEGVCDLNGNCT